ncbi:MAG: cyclase family protein [Chloroflexi bacterium]|nr:cyclase family protein [Chloroflexota bacterium]
MTAPTRERLGVKEFQPIFDRCSNWGRWGADDERGALNLITPEKRIQAAGLVREGTTVSLAHPINTVGDAENISPAVHLMVRAGDVVDGVTVTSIADHLAVSPHGQAHSHLDALCHFAWQGQIYNGRPVTAVTSMGAKANAITIGQDGIVSRGVLLDIPRLKGVDFLEPNQSISVADLEAAEAAAGLRVEPGDILLVRTGRHVRRKAKGPWDSRVTLAGLHHEVGPWLKDRDIALLGSDGVSDYREHPFDCCSHPIHVLTLVAMGAQLLDNQNLDDIAVACAERSRWAFMLVIAPLKLVGGTASMTNPIAIF